MKRAGRSAEGRTRDLGLERVTVGISDLAASAAPRTCLATFALGSCVAVQLWAARRRAGGLLHFMLPDSALNPAKAAERPAMFADTGLALLLTRLGEIGVRPGELVAKLVGGGSLNSICTHFPIGEDNQRAARTLLARAGIRVVAAEVGGQRSRSTFFYIDSGRVLVRSPSGEVEL